MLSFSPSRSAVFLLSLFAACASARFYPAPADFLAPADLTKREPGSAPLKLVSLMTNAERLRAGYPLLRPRQLYSPTRVRLARSQASPLPPGSNLIIDGGFEAWETSGFSYTATDQPHWAAESENGGDFDASFFNFASYARTGERVALLGSATGADSHSGSIYPREPLNTVPGTVYTLGLWAQSTFGGPSNEANAFFEIIWNGVVVSRVDTGYQDWTHHEFVLPSALGSDTLKIRGGRAPAWTFIDDITLVEVI